jgi:hypothetical protein
MPMRVWRPIAMFAGLAVAVALACLPRTAGAAGTLDFDPPGPPTLSDFTPVTLNGSPQLSSASLSPFSVTDATGSGNGWSLDFKMTPLTAGGRVLPPGSVTMNRPVVAPAAGNGAPAPTTIDCRETAAIDTTDGCGVAVATPGAGAGTWLFSPAPVVVSLPANAFAGSYTATFTVVLSSGP